MLELIEHMRCPIHIATQSYQIRKHRKKRINKKWLKKYGCHEIDLIPNGEVVMYNGVIWMNKKTWEQIKEESNGKT